jgi:hypothetical protein
MVNFELENIHCFLDCFQINIIKLSHHEYIKGLEHGILEN